MNRLPATEIPAPAPAKRQGGTERGSWKTLPNLLTLSRLLVAFLVLLCLGLGFPGAKVLALVLFVAGALTDLLDGHLARRSGQVSAFGQLMDPLTDKVLVCAAFIAFVELGLMRAWLVVLIIAREFLVTGLRLLAASSGMVLSAGRWGKHKTVWQLVAIILLLAGLALQHDLLPEGSVWQERCAQLLPQAGFVLGLAVAALTLVSGAVYFHEHRNLLRGKQAADPATARRAPAR